MHQGQLGGFNHLFTAQGCLYQPLQLALGIQHVHLHGQQNRLLTLSTLTSTSSLISGEQGLRVGGICQEADVQVVRSRRIFLARISLISRCLGTGWVRPVRGW